MPTREQSLGNTITRRTLVAGQRAGTFALATDTASAQRCAGPPPPHVKGRRVWLDLDSGRSSTTATISRSTPTHTATISERHAANNEKALSVIGKPERIAYGLADIEKVDIYKTKRRTRRSWCSSMGGLAQRAVGQLRHLCRAVHQGGGQLSSRSTSTTCARPRATCFRWSTSAGGRSLGSTGTPRVSAAMPTSSISAAARRAAISPAAC